MSKTTPEGLTSWEMKKIQGFLIKANKGQLEFLERELKRRLSK